MSTQSQQITVRPVDGDNWREVSALTTTQAQQAFVAEPNFYLALCCYDTWNPLAVYLGETVIGFMMWGLEDESCWLGGILIDQQYQGRGYGRRAVQEAIRVLTEQTGASELALSYRPTNAVARHLYTSMGFVETGETEDGEVVARLKLSDLQGRSS